MTGRHSTGVAEPVPAVDDTLLRDIGLMLYSGTPRAGQVDERDRRLCRVSSGRVTQWLASEPMQRLRAAWTAEAQGLLSQVGAHALAVERERDEARAELAAAHQGRNLLAAEVERLRAAQPVLPDVGPVVRDGDRLLVAGGAGLGTSFHDDLEDGWLLLNVARNLAVLAYRERERLDAEQPDTTTNDEVDGYCVCDGPLSPARDCGIRAHRTAAARARQTGEA